MKLSLVIALTVSAAALFLFLAAPGMTQGQRIGGSYQVTGTNPDGGTYQGTVTISKSGHMYKFSWTVGNSYEGLGVLVGDVLTVQWGDQYPVIYRVMEGGRVLEGTWSNGKATETLTRMGE